MCVLYEQRRPLSQTLVLMSPPGEDVGDHVSDLLHATSIYTTGEIDQYCLSFNASNGVVFTNTHGCPKVRMVV